ncbi:MAG TPA: DNA polymerase Y family protein [Ramlibacter sp.]|uniref:DNA polymerase Y family protein n=1 Tax=Ramlibacter sp. TaxID=1917967 RepID=UPI002CC29BCB|nr:DNA polymerase Y family protein [Ramlibacter sp.]HVZ43377.1 DNA polymerase Y family protein [Ramlibacter sp.]
MFWIALRPTHEEERQAWGWRALQFTPRVAFLDEALVLEVSACERLWGGRRRLLRKLFKPHEALSSMPVWASGATSLVALALLRLRGEGTPERIPEFVPDGLPVHTLSAARDHLPILERIGCNTWGGLRALPSAGVSRRFGAALLRALDHAYGAQPESHAWIALPEHFDVKLELPALACSAPELMWTGQRLLSQLQLWLQARNRGVLALELEWTLDLKRLDGKPLPPCEQLEVRTAQPTQDMAHLRRLVSEHLSRRAIAAPANHLRLRSLETVPWGGVTTSLLPEDNRKGEKLHQLVERLSVRLGEGNVRVPVAHEDHRPERMQEWVAARGVRGTRGTTSPSTPIYPTWLLPHPIPLEVKAEVPHYHGPLRRLTRLYRLETGWWEENGPALRDYFIASSDEAGLVWIFRERPASTGRSRWYLQGLYA